MRQISRPSCAFITPGLEQTLSSLEQLEKFGKAANVASGSVWRDISRAGFHLSIVTSVIAGLAPVSDPGLRRERILIGR